MTAPARNNWPHEDLRSDFGQLTERDLDARLSERAAAFDIADQVERNRRAALWGAGSVEPWAAGMQPNDTAWMRDGSAPEAASACTEIGQQPEADFAGSLLARVPTGWYLLASALSVIGAAAWAVFA